MDKETRRCYFKTTNQIVLPPNPQWRYWKFALEDGTWKIIKGINNIPQLRDYLVKLNPVAFYYSTSEFLNQEVPDKIEHPNYQTADQLFMFNKYFVVDIDNELGTDQVRNTAEQVLRRMEYFNEAYLYEKCIFTGRGCRLEFIDVTESPKDMLPHEKEEWIKRTRKEFCLKNLADIPHVDHVIAWDTRRIIKGIGSPNPHNEYTTEIISDPSYIPAMLGKAQANEMDGGVHLLVQEQGRLPDQELGYSLFPIKRHMSYPMFFGKFIRNKVEGTKDRFVPYFEYHKKYRHWHEDLKFLQKMYGLSTIFVVDDYMKVMCVSIDAIPAPRLDKIYSNSNSIVKNMWRKFRNLYMRTSGLFDMNLNRLNEYDLKPLFQIEDSPTKIHPISKPHLDLVNHLGFDTTSVVTDRMQIGNEKNNIYESFFENRKKNKVKEDGE